MSKGFSKGVNFHTSANKYFGGNTRPSTVQVRGHTRAMPAPRTSPVQAFARGGAVCAPSAMKKAAEAAVERHIASPAPRGHKGLKK